MISKMTWGLGSSPSEKKTETAAAGGHGGASDGGINLVNDIKALVVDDNRVSRKVLMMMLKWARVGAQEAENGKQAVDLHAAARQPFHVIFMDMQMPVMDGPEATRILKSMGVKAKIVGVSGNCRSSDREAFMAAGLDEFYVKPLSRDAFVDLLRRVDNEISQSSSGIYM